MKFSCAQASLAASMFTGVYIFADSLSDYCFGPACPGSCGAVAGGETMFRDSPRKWSLPFRSNDV